MLRKKLSKLIVGVLTAVLLSVGVVKVGQPVYASSVSENVSTRALIQNINSSTSESDIISYIQNDVLTLNVSGSVKLTQKIVDAINSKKQSVTFEISNSAKLIVSENISADEGKLILTRGKSKTGALLEVEAQTSNVSRRSIDINGILFDNNEVDDSAFINNDSSTDVMLERNILFGGGKLSADSTKNTKYASNIINDGLVDSNTIVSFTNNKVQFCVDSLSVSGKLKVNNKSVKEASIIVYDNTGERVGDEVTFDLNNDGSFSETLLEGILASGEKYTVDVEFQDEFGNTYIREIGEGQTYKFTMQLLNPTNNSVDVRIDVGNLPASKYDLDFTILNNNKVLHQYRISYSDRSKLSNFVVDRLSPGTSYSFRLEDKDGHIIGEQIIKTTGSSSTVTGGEGNIGSTNSLDVTNSDILKATITDVDAIIPIGSTTLVNSLKYGRDFTTNIEGVTVTFINGKFEFKGLVPEKEYKDLMVNYIDKNSVKKIVKVATFKSKSSSTKLRQFIIDVYKQSLNRLPDEKGFAYWEQELKNKRIVPSEMVKNLLNEKEFLNQNTTVQSKIEGLYKVIVNRASDAQGLEFWKNKYETIISEGQNDLKALENISNQMVSEKEFKDRISSLGI